MKSGVLCEELRKRGLRLTALDYRYKGHKRGAWEAAVELDLVLPFRITADVAEQEGCEWCVATAVAATMLSELRMLVGLDRLNHRGLHAKPGKLVVKIAKAALKMDRAMRKAVKGGRA